MWKRKKRLSNVTWGAGNFAYNHIRAARKAWAGRMRGAAVFLESCCVRAVQYAVLRDAPFR